MTLQDDVFINKVIAYLQRADKTARPDVIAYIERVESRLKELPLCSLIRVQEEYARYLKDSK